MRARQGKLKAVKLGRNWVTTKDWLDDYVQRATEYNNVNSNGNSNGKAKEKKIFLPPDDLPVGELQFRKTGFRERLYELRFNLKPDIQNIRSALVTALVISLIMAGGIFGKGSLTQVYDDVSPVVKKVHVNFQEGLSVVDGKIDQRLLAIDSKLADYGSLLNNAGLAAVEKVAGQTIPVEGQQVTVRATLAGAAEIWHGYSEWISGELLAFWGDIKNSAVGRTYITLNNSIEEGLARDFNSIKTFYVSANTETQDFLFPLCRGIVQGYSKANDAATEALRGMGRGIKNGYVSANNFLDEKIGGGVEVAKNSLKKIKDIVTAPWGEEKIVVEPETGDLSQEIEELRSELEQLKKEPFVVKRVEVERVVEQVQEITKTIETTERTVDEEALAQVWSDIEYLEQEMAKRLYAPGGVISQTIYVTEPVRSPKIYQENGEIVLQTTGSGNIILSAATGLQLYGSQVVINSTSLLNPLVYIADSTKIEGDLTVSGSISGGALSISSITATGDAAISGDVSIGGSLTVSATTTLAVDEGYVGIATSTPSTNLAVAGNIMGSGNLVLYGSATSTIAGPITSGSIYPSLDVTYYLGSPSYRWANIYAATSTFGGTIVVGSDVIRGSATTTLTTIGNSNQIVLGADGNVGIGTSTMSGLLTVGTSTPSLVVAANGYVGISTTTPSYALEVSGTVKTDDFITKGPWVDVRAFGAAGDGITDDTDAVNSALASLGTHGGTVYFPPGIYLVGDITVSQNSVIIQGAGRALSSGIATSTTEIRAKAGSTRSLYITGNNVVIKDLYINGNSNAVQFEVNGPYCIIDNIYSSGHTQYQLNRNSTGVCRITNSSFIGQARTISNAINITGNYFNGNGAVTALTVDGGANVVIHGNTFESYTTAIAMATSGSSFVVSANITSNYFESSFDDNSSVVQIGHSSPSSYSVNILNNYFGATDADYFISASYLESLVIQGNNFHGSPAVENINIGSGVNKLVGSTNRDGDAAGVLGVGTSTPRYLLDVWGDLAVGTSTDSDTPVLYVKSGTGYGSVGIGTTTPTGLLTVGTTTPALVVTDSGKVGIGTTTPTEALTVVGNIVGTGNITVTGDYVTLSGNIMPSSPQVSDIGSPAYDWANIYVDNVYANNILAASSSIAGTTANMFTINSDAVSDATSTLRFYRGADTPHAILNWDAGYDRFNLNFPLYLSGTGVISSAGALTLSSGGAGDIILNPAGNVGIGIQSASSKLMVFGGDITVGDGTATTTIGYTDSTITGSLTVTATTTAASMNIGFGNLYMSESGNVGIGTTTPNFSLAIQGTDAILIPVGTDAQRPVGTAGMVRYNTDVSTFEGYNGNAWTGLGGVIDVDQDTYILAELNSGSDDDALFFYTGGSEKMMINSSGNVGIGTTAPSSKLTVFGGNLVVGNGSATSTITNGEINLDYGISAATGTIANLTVTATTTSGTLNVGSGNLYVSENGNVGIGTTTPGYTLDVDGIVNSTALYVNGSPYIGSQWTTLDNDIYYTTGNVGIGTVTPYAKLTINESDDFAFGFFNGNVIDNMDDVILVWLSSNATVSTSTETSIVKTGSQSLNITASGVSEDVTVKNTLSSAQDWSSYERIGFWIRTDRFATSTATSTQLISFQYHDSGGVINTHNITFLEEDRWQYEEVALTSTITDKDAVDYVQFRVDFGGTGDINFYIDQIRVYDDDERTADMFVDKEGILTVTGRGGVEIYAPRAGAGSLPGVRVDGAVVELGQPLSVNTGGNVGFDYDLEFLNTGLSQITSEGPLRIAAGPSYRSYNLTLASGGTGDVIVELSQASSSMMITQAAYATTTSFIINSEANATSTYLMKAYSDVNSDENVVFAVDAAGNLTYDGTASSPASDVAENYKVADESIKVGDVVCLAESGGLRVEKCSEPYQETILGVISTRPAVLMGGALSDSKPVALNGRVPVTVSGENGSIHVGDPLTSASSTPGVAMKATGSGKIFGYALEPFDGTATSTSKILAFVNLESRSGGDLTVTQDGDGIKVSTIIGGTSTAAFIIDSEGALVVSKLKADEIETQGITIYDRITGDPYCITMENGEINTATGKCNIAGVGEALSGAIGGDSPQVCTNGENRPCGADTCDFELGECPGVCEIGVQVCEDGQWSECMDSVMPSEEIFDGVDNDCDGEIDEGGETVGESASTTTDEIIEDSTSTDSIIEDSSTTDSIIDSTSTDSDISTTTATTTD